MGSGRGKPLLKKFFIANKRMGSTSSFSIPIFAILLLAHSTTQLYVNDNGPIQLGSSIDIKQGFSFKFRTCTSGTLLYQGNETSYFQVTLTLTNLTAFSTLMLSWRYGNQVQHQQLQDHFAFDRNTIVEVNLFITNGQKPIFRLSGPISINRTISNDSLLMKINNSGPLLLGQNGYNGCLYDGKGVNLSTALSVSKFQTRCPLEDSIPCSEKVCPAGFAGQFCDKNINECGSYPCHSHATCVDGINSFKCICGPQWTGPTCATFLGSLCHISTCKNQGLCQESLDRNNYTCVCPKGFTGRNCENILYPCTTKPCLNGGSCYNWTTGAIFVYNCTCKDGFKGINCELNIDECSQHPCNNGLCIDGSNNYTCNCNGTGFQGRLCDEDVNECAAMIPCKNNGTCTNTYGGFKCSCAAGYAGPTCQLDIRECNNSPCLNNGTCIERFGHYKCDCIPGFTGQNCESNVIDCSGIKCGNGTCIDGINAYACNCSAGYTGRHCETNIDECASKPCWNNGTCVDEINGYKCQCLGAFNGTHCEAWNDLCSLSPCLNNGTCIPRNETKVGYECNCSKTGYAGPRCQFVPGFCYPNDPCQHGKCNDYGSFYNCTCDAGYQGVNCSLDINECDASPCQFSGTCRNTPGSYSCTCTPYSTGNNCQTDIYRCNPACQNEGACRNLTGIRDVCLCPGGWIGDACERRIDYCANDKPYCGNGRCENFYSESSNFALCVCNEGFMGSNCTTDINECSLGYCRNNVSCTNGIGNYSCGCMPGYSGKNCTQNIDECASNPCRNNGTCQDEINGYRCKCRLGFNGTQCQNDINWCEGNPCKNDGNCTDGIETYNCTCHKGYIGRNCTVDVNECLSSPCQFGGRCIERSNLTALIANGKFTKDLKNNYANRHGYICICKPGFTGVNCAVNIDECAGSPCKNNATCKDLINGYNCTCLPGFTGKNCSTNINECASNPCMNNATCMDLVNEYRCQCKGKYTGIRCESAINQCIVSSPCLNGGGCTQDGTSYRCTCRVGFTGQNCELNTTLEFDGNANWTLKSNARSIEFQFRTTLKNGLLLQILSADGVSVYFGLSNEGIVVQSDSRSKSSYSNIAATNGDWHNISISFDAKSLNFTIDGKYYMYGEGLINAVSYHLGLANSSFAKMKDFPGFVGCIQDVKLNGNKAAPGRDGQLNGGVIGTCNWKRSCGKLPCKNGGLCVDLWSQYTCKCSRRFFGADCAQPYEAFTFGPSLPIKAAPTNNTSRRRRSISSQPGNETNFLLSIVNTTFDSNSSISLSIRTRALNGLLFLLSSNGPNTGSASVTSYLTLQLLKGELFFKYNHNSESKSTNTKKIVNDGSWHDIHVNKQNVSVDSTVIYMPGVSGNMPARYFYVGGVNNVTFFASALETSTQYSGCLQAVSLNGATLALKPVSGGGAIQSVNSSNAQSGCNGTDVCGNSPCKNGGNCTDLWNAYKCTCPMGYSGETCSLHGCIVKNPCPVHKTCLDLKSGTVTCISATTFNGSESNATFSSLIVRNASSFSFSLRTRSSSAFIIGASSNNSHYFAIGLNGGKIQIVYRYWDMVSETTITGARAINDGNWYDILVKTESSTTIMINTTIDASESHRVLGDHSKTLLEKSGLTVGKTSKQYLASSFNGSFFKGCFAKLLIGAELFSFNQSVNVGLKDGCHSTNLCIDRPCIRGQCIDTFDSYRCDCPAHYAGERCTITNNVTCGFSSNLCHPSSTCVNLTNSKTRKYSQSGNDLFQCNCAVGYTGYLCFTLIDYCNGTNPCVNGTCVSSIGDYSCNCNNGFTGKNCSVSINDCASNPCQNGGSCIDGLNSYACACTSTYAGQHCQTLVSGKSTSDSKIGLWIGIAVAIVVVILIVVVFLRYCKGQQGMQGTYSPSRQEKGQVEMASMPPIPPKERLI